MAADYRQAAGSYLILLLFLNIMRKYEPLYIHKKFLFICYTTTERILKICPVPYKHKLNLDKLKLIVTHANTN